MCKESSIFISGKFYVLFTHLTFSFGLSPNIFPARSSSQNSGFNLFIFHHATLIFIFWLLLHCQDESFIYSLHT